MAEAAPKTEEQPTEQPTEQATKKEEPKPEATKDADGDVAVTDADDTKKDDASKPKEDDTTAPTDEQADDSKTDEPLPPTVAPDLTANEEDAAKTENFQFNADIEFNY